MAENIPLIIKNDTEIKIIDAKLVPMIVFIPADIPPFTLLLATNTATGPGVPKNTTIELTYNNIRV
ncbi:hypothetical protein [Pseudoalteromonas phenolica]|uniref:hypothetical protein n=1 Tax=Pseudoalteromonas phenolica TaxID=161398 RepID=UPI000FFEA026|nr:hypothetical protein [Pseudoalteromonas phenolica]RXF03032.1 hypothetical protein D9981_06410 [Pseudoalteromonas phenolica O-BC30]